MTLAALVEWLKQSAEFGVTHEPGAAGGETVVVLPGETKLRTTVSVRETADALRFTAFVIRHPDEADEQFQRYLLQHNASGNRRWTWFGTDRHGDVYLHARLPTAAATVSLLDDVFGELLQVADTSFNPLLKIGFRSAIQREWRWRIARGEPTANLEAFRHLRTPGS